MARRLAHSKQEEKQWEEKLESIKPYINGRPVKEFCELIERERLIEAKVDICNDGLI